MTCDRRTKRTSREIQVSVESLGERIAPAGHHFGLMGAANHVFLNIEIKKHQNNSDRLERRFESVNHLDNLVSGPHITHTTNPLVAKNLLTVNPPVVANPPQITVTTNPLVAKNLLTLNPPVVANPPQITVTTNPLVAKNLLTVNPPGVVNPPQITVTTNPVVPTNLLTTNPPVQGPELMPTTSPVVPTNPTWMLTPPTDPIGPLNPVVM